MKIEQAEGRAPQDELEFFIKGEICTEFNSYKTINYTHHKYVQSKFSYFLISCVGNLSLEKSKRKKPCDWLPDQGWEDIVKLAELFPEQFGSLPDDMEKNSNDWKFVS